MADFGAFGKKDEKKRDQQQQSQTVDPFGTRAPAYTSGVEHGFPPGVSQQSQTADPVDTRAPAYAGGVQHGFPPGVSQQHQRYGQDEGGNTQQESQRNGQGEGGNKDQEMWSPRYPLGEGGNKQDEPQRYGGDSNVAEDKDRGLFAFGKKNEDKKDQFGQQQQPQTVDAFGKKNEEKKDQLGQQQPQAVDVFGKKNEEKKDQYGQKQPQTVDPFATHATAYGGGVQRAAPSAVSQQPQSYGQGEGGNKKEESQRYGLGEGGDKQHEPQRSGFGEGGNKHQEPQRYGFGEGGNKQNEPKRYGQGDSNVAEDKDRGLFAFGKKDEENKDEHLQQQSQTVDPFATQAPAYTGLGESGIKQQETKRYGQGDSNVVEHKDSGVFGAFGKKDEQKKDEHLQQQSHSPAYGGGVQPTPPPQQPQRSGLGEGGNKHQEPQRYGLGEGGDKQHEPQRYGQGDPNVAEHKDSGLFGALGKKDDEKKDKPAPAYNGGVQHTPPAVSQQPQHPGLGERGKKQHEPERSGLGEGGNKHQDPQLYGLGEGGNKQHEAQRYGQGDPNVAEHKDSGLFPALGTKDEEKKDHHAPKQSQTVDPKATHGPAYGGGVQHTPPPAVSQQQPKRTGHGEGGNGQHEHQQRYGQGEGGNKQHEPQQRYGEGEGGNRQHEPQRYGEGEGGYKGEERRYPLGERLEPRPYSRPHEPQGEAAKLPGHQAEKETKEEPEKKGMIEKIKENLPGRKEGGREI